MCATQASASTRVRNPIRSRLGKEATAHLPGAIVLIRIGSAFSFDEIGTPSISHLHEGGHGRRLFLEDRQRGSPSGVKTTPMGRAAYPWVGT